jgi:hypothetical protein
VLINYGEFFFGESPGCDVRSSDEERHSPSPSPSPSSPFFSPPSPFSVEFDATWERCEGHDHPPGACKAATTAVESARKVMRTGILV